MGLGVQVCSQPAFGWVPIDHQRIKTDTVEAGMGGASCSKVDNGDEKKVDNQL